MLHYLIELALLLLVSYFAGACVGCLLRKLFGGEEEVAVAQAVAEPVSRPAASIAPYKPVPAEPAMRAAEPVHRPPPAPVVPPPQVLKPAAPPPAEPAMAAGKMERPKGIAAARGGKADNLQRISGIGPKNENILHGLGFFHFDQIAAWTAEQINWVDDHLKFNGRIRREEWINQARLLADGKDEEFKKLYGRGSQRNRKG